MKQLLKFSPSWCSPCKIISKVMEDQEIDIEEEFEYTNKFEIHGFPTLVLFNDDIEVNKKEQLKIKGEIESMKQRMAA